MALKIILSHPLKRTRIDHIFKNEQCYKTEMYREGSKPQSFRVAGINRASRT